MTRLINKLCLIGICGFALMPLAASNPKEHLATLSPAERKIRQAEKKIAEKPEFCEAYADLAMALAQRARETANHDFYHKALEVLDKAFAIDSNHYQARRAEAWCLLGHHDFAKALSLAEALNKRNPDDLMTYAMLVDAHLELGGYQEAARLGQVMLDRNPVSIPVLTRAAYIRELHGETSGAIEMMQQAMLRLPNHAVEDKAWVLCHLALLHLGRAELEIAEKLCDQALQAFPDYHYALLTLAKVKHAQKDYEQAVTLHQKHYQVAPHPEYLYYLGQALKQVGREKEALEAFKTFEVGAHGEMESHDNSNRDLIFYYCEEGQNPKEALKLASQEWEKYKTIYHSQAYAWALYQNGDTQKAQEMIDHALSLGTEDATMHYHAGMIALKNNDALAARQHFKKATQWQPWNEEYELMLAKSYQDRS